MSDRLNFTKLAARFEDQYTAVPVYQVTGGPANFSAFVYQCRLNLDIDGAPTTYGYDNPADKNSQGGANLQKNLEPLENWKKGQKGISVSQPQKVGLGNACGDPGDGTKGWKNFHNGNHNFYWAGIIAVTKIQARQQGLIIDDRAELEAGLAYNSPKPKVLPVGSGYFPVVQDQNGTAPGYYISTTSVTTDSKLSHYDPHRYLDATVVPYAVWANHWTKWKIGGKNVAQGDFGLAIRNATGANIGYVYGDAGTSVKVGESSQKLHSALGGSNDLVTFIAFPGSGPGRALGKDPEKSIQVKVWMNTLRLGSNATELATRIALGQNMAIPRNQAETTFEQDRIYKNVYSALSRWASIF